MFSWALSYIINYKWRGNTNIPRQSRQILTQTHQGKMRFLRANVKNSNSYPISTVTLTGLIDTLRWRPAISYQRIASLTFPQKAVDHAMNATEIERYLRYEVSRMFLTDKCVDSWTAFSDGLAVMCVEPLAEFDPTESNWISCNVIKVGWMAKIVWISVRGLTDRRKN